MQTHPNMVLLAEDVRAKRWSLHDIVREISDVVQARSEQGKEFGAILVRGRREGRLLRGASIPIAAWRVYCGLIRAYLQLGAPS